jgi:hypothetical protein
LTRFPVVIGGGEKLAPGAALNRRDLSRPYVKALSPKPPHPIPKLRSRYSDRLIFERDRHVEGGGESTFRTVLQSSSYNRIKGGRYSLLIDAWRCDRLSLSSRRE